MVSPFIFERLFFYHYFTTSGFYLSAFALSDDPDYVSGMGASDDISSCRCCSHPHRDGPAFQGRPLPNAIDLLPVELIRLVQKPRSTPYPY